MSVAECFGVVAVGDGGGLIVCTVAAEGGAVVIGHRLAFSNSGRVNEAVSNLDGLVVTLPSHEAAVAAAYTVLLEYLSVEEASVEGNGIVGISAPAHKTAAAAGAGDDGAALAVGERDGVLAEAHEAAHPVFCGVDFDRARAALDGDAAKEVADESSHAGVAGACVGSVDMSVDVEVDELGAARHLYEGGYELGIDGGLGGAVVECQRFVVAIEGACEGVVAAARHLRHADVGTEFHGLATEVVVGFVVLQGVAKQTPASGGVDGVGIAVVADGEVVGVGSPLGVERDVFSHSVVVEVPCIGTVTFLVPATENIVRASRYCRFICFDDGLSVFQPDSLRCNGRTTLRIKRHGVRRPVLKTVSVVVNVIHRRVRDTECTALRGTLTTTYSLSSIRGACCNSGIASNSDGTEGGLVTTAYTSPTKAARSNYFCTVGYQDCALCSCLTTSTNASPTRAAGYVKVAAVNVDITRRNTMSGISASAYAGIISIRSCNCQLSHAATFRL